MIVLEKKAVRYVSGGKCHCKCKEWYGEMSRWHGLIMIRRKELVDLGVVANRVECGRRCSKVTQRNIESCKDI